MASYEELKQELVEISKIVDKFPEAVKPKVYDLLVEQFLGVAPSSNENTEEQAKTPATKKKKSTPKKKAASTEAKPKRSSGKESYSLDRHLDLRGDGSIPSFKEFYEEKNPKGAKQTNAVAVYYLKKMKGMSEVTLDHVYTCYSEVKKKPPQAFRQSFTDTKNKEGWIEFEANGNLDIPHRGVVYVEHDLPAKSEK
ncbi:MAG: hypothetical protein RRB22_11420 [Gammaproteobacteria bacterium]|nr:hypothetical protein [Gammaproteobacteria bacterium]